MRQASGNQLAQAPSVKLESVGMALLLNSHLDHLNQLRVKSRSCTRNLLYA